MRDKFTILHPTLQVSELTGPPYVLDSQAIVGRLIKGELGSLDCEVRIVKSTDNLLLRKDVKEKIVNQQAYMNLRKDNK